MAKPIDPLEHWLSLAWNRPERSYNPDLRDFLSGVLDYPKNKVITEDSGPGGFPDIKLKSPEDIAWVVGDLKKNDGTLTDPDLRMSLWDEKRKYVDGLTRFVLFITAHYVWIVLPNGAEIPLFGPPLDLRTIGLEDLKARLSFCNYAAASHECQWGDLISGILPYSYLELNDTTSVKHLRDDLRTGFSELTTASTKAMAALGAQYANYVRRRDDIERNLVGKHDTQRRAKVRLELEFEFVRRLFTESLPQFEEQYGREPEANTRIHEAFVADSVAALMARVLFLRLVEDLGLTQKRRLTNGGPSNWFAFVEYLTGDARALVRIASEDVARIYREPFARSVFDWIAQANGELDIALQRYILRLNAYNFAGLSEEILGDIYQQFLPLQKRKQLGEYYTPQTIVDWILDRTVRTHGLGAVLDPSCGSGSFLVRYTHWRLEDAARRNLDAQMIRREVQEEVWGFDLNPFASFISLFQITWALLRHRVDIDPPHVHVYNINSLLSDADIAAFMGEEHLAPGSRARDEKKWKYVLGNPPYIRAERVKYGGEMRDLWAHVWGQNSDTGLIFLYRSLTEWLEPGGFLGMVVSGGYANSEAAAKIWNLLLPGGGAALRQIAWLEFVEQDGKPMSVWDAARVPMIIVIERTPAKEDDQIQLHVPSAWPSGEEPVKIGYRDFFDRHICPNVTNPLSPWGDYLLPLLRPGDLPVLFKLDPSQSTLTTLGEVAKWTYGVQRGGVEVTPEPTGQNPIQIIAGRSLAVAWPGEPAGWVDLGAVGQRPNGKLSLWRGKTYPDKFIAIATLGRAPFAAVVQADGGLASVNTTIVSQHCLVKPEAVAAYLNSHLARFYWAIRLRTAVVESYWATFYPRTFEVLPWPKNLSKEREEQFAAGYNRLAELAARAKNNPGEWLLSEAERHIETGRVLLSDSALELRFPQGAIEARTRELQLDGNRLNAGGLTFVEVSDPILMEYILRLLQFTTDEDASIGTLMIQKLVVPLNYSRLMREYRERNDAFQEVERDFLAALSVVNDAVYEAFGVEEERGYIEERLSSFPLNRLQPRYPWETVRPRPIKTYMADRYS